MKIERLIPMGLTLVFFVLSGCEKMKIHEYRGPEDSQIEFSFNGTNTSPIASWEVGSRTGVYTADSDGVGGANVNAAFEVGDGDLDNSGKAIFSGMLSISTPTGTNKLYAYYPHVSISTITPYDAVPLTLAATQTMSGTSHDSSCSYMYASTDISVTTSGNSLAFTSGDLNFQPLVGIVNLKVTDFDSGADIASTVSSGDVVSSVSITASGASENPKLAGSFTLDLSTGVMDFGSGTGNRVTVNCPSDMTLGLLSARMAVNPFTVSGTEESLDIKITIGETILVKTIVAEDLSAGTSFEVTAGNASVIEVSIDDSWAVENVVPGKVDELYLVTNNVGPTTMCFGWAELEDGALTRTYIAQLFTDKTGSAVYTSPTLTYKTGNSLYIGTYPETEREGYGPTRFTFTELEPNTTYYMRVKHSSYGDEAYSEFLQGTTQPVHVPSDKEVFYEGFDKLYWGSDPMNSASAAQPATLSPDTACPAGWENLTTIRTSDAGTTASLNTIGAFTNANNDYGITGWRYTTTTYSYPSAGYMKLGGASTAGTIITSVMGSDILPPEGAECTLSFKACPFVVTDRGYINVYVIHNDTEAAGTGAMPTEATNILTYAGNSGLNARDTATDIYIGEDLRQADCQWLERTFTIPDLKPTDKIWFISTGAPCYRFLLDEIRIETVDTSSTPLRAPTVLIDDSATGTDQLKVTWAAIGRAVSYTLAYKKTADTDFTEIADITATGHILTALDPNTEYQIKVKAVAANTTLNSEYSAVATGTTLTAAQSKLDAPADIAAEAAFSTVAVTWTVVDGAVGYTIAVDGTDKETVGAVTTGTITGLELNKPYEIKVKAIASDTQYNSDYSAAVQVTTKNLYLQTTNIGPTTLCLGWEEVDYSGATRTYVVQLFTDKTGNPVYTSPTLTYKTNNALYAGTFPGTEREGYGPTRFTFPELSPDTKYYMRVKHSTDDDTAYSDFIEAITEPSHTPVAGEVLYQGFDKLFWSSDPINSASGAQPATLNPDTACPAGWANLTSIRLSDGSTTASLNTMGAFTNANNDYGLDGWRYTSHTYAYPSAGYVKLGNGTNAGNIITSAMGSDVLPPAGAECTLTFKACPFVVTDRGFINVYIVHNDTEATGSATVPAETTNIMTYAGNSGLNDYDTVTDIYIGEDYRAANCRWLERSFTIPNLKPTDKIWFISIGTPCFRWLLDDIHVVMK